MTESMRHRARRPLAYSWPWLVACCSLALAGCGDATPAPEPMDEPPRAADFEIVYSLETEGGSALFGLNLADGVPSRLTEPSDFAGYPVWSPDGARVAFLAEGPDASGLMALDAESGDVSVLVPGTPEPADWTPDGARLLVTRNLEEGGRSLFVFDPAGGAEDRIETGGSADAYARWAPTGDFVVFESGRDGNPEIYRTDLGTGEATRLTENPELDEWPSVSPDGEWIAWASGNEDEKDLWLMRADGSEPRRVTHGMMFGDAFPEWSPEGDRILLTVREGDVFVLVLVDVESGDVSQIGEGAAATWR